MVLQQSHRRHVASQPTGLDISRILGISSTLAINVLALLLLLIPSNMPAPISWNEPKPTTEAVPIVPVKPKPEKQPEKVEVVKQRTTPAPTTKPTTVTTPVEHPITYPDGEVFVETTVEATGDVAGPPDIAPPSAPLQGMRLEYANTPSPAYPRDAIRNNLQGTVMLEVLVDVDGKPIKVTIHSSSGHRILDQEAVRHVLRRWTFRPAMKDGRAVQAIGLVPIEFTLDRM